ncbi:hypothetical protein [Frankia sp. R82]|uniref:phage tail protein n=1 Tax=Frankia sp. R82 TaxID=2950553 RepID=UPI002044011C|nr:hypothetical protein [Frankia sp. R82]MCM3884177.1 hypothetical protein [Frankia sp. R82]
MTTLDERPAGGQDAPDVEELTGLGLLQLAISEMEASDPRALQVETGASQAMGCRAESLWRLLRIPESDPRLRADSWMGKAAHAAAEAALRRLPDRFRLLVEFRAVYRKVACTIDLGFILAGRVVDWKFPRLSKIARLKKDGIGRGYRAQVHLAGAALREAGYDIHTVGLVFVPRDGDFEDAWEFSEPFDQKIADEAADRVATERARATEMAGILDRFGAESTDDKITEIRRAIDKWEIRDEDYFFCRTFCSYGTNCRGPEPKFPSPPDDGALEAAQQVAAAWAQEQEAKALWVLFSQHLWPILTDIGRVFLAASRSAGAFGDAAGNSGIEGLGKGLDTLRQQLGPIFRNLIEFFQQIAPFNRAMGQVFSQIIIPVLLFFAKVVGAIVLPAVNAFVWVLAHVLGPTLGGAGGQISAHTRTLGVLAAGFMIFHRFVSPILGTRNALRLLIQGLRDARALWNVSRLLSFARGFQALAGFIARMTPGVRILMSLRDAIRRVGGAFSLISRGISIVRTAFTAFSAFLAANPLGALLLVLGLLVGAFILAYTHSQRFRNLVHGALQWVGNAAKAVGHFFQELPGQILGFFGKAPELLKEAGGKILEGLLWGIKMYWNIIVFWYVGLPLMILGFFLNAAQWLFDAGVRVLRGLLGGLQNGWTAASSWVGRIPGVIGGLFADAGRWLFDAGEHIIQGLIDGLKHAAGKIGDTMHSIVSKIKGYLPFSPAKEGPLSGRGNPFYSGQSIVRLLAQGIGGQMGTVDAAMGQLTGRLTPGAFGPAATSWAGAAASWAGNLAASAGGQPAGKPADIVVQIDGREVFRAVQTQALQSERRNLTNGLSAAGQGQRALGAA